MIKKIVITHLSQIKLIQKLNWKLGHILYQISEHRRAGPKNGFLMLLFDSTLPSFNTAYLDEARHRVLVCVAQNSSPSCVLLHPEQYDVTQGDILD